MTEPRSEAWTATAEEPESEATESLPKGEASDDDDIDGLDARSREVVQKARREAHNLRTRLREAEEQIGGYAARETERDRIEVERIAGEHLVEAADIWRAQPDIQQFYDEEFHSITRDRVVEAAKQLASEKPHLARPQAAPPPTDRPLESLRGGARAPEDKTPTTWASALRGR